jgi:metaxin
LTENFEDFVAPNLPLPNGPEPLEYIAKHLYQSVCLKDLEKQSLANVRKDVLYEEAEYAYNALSTLLGDDEYFFNAEFFYFKGQTDGRKPGLLDCAMFAYTWTVLDRSELGDIARKFCNLVSHAELIFDTVYR